jgi:hypothetical protein
MMHEPQREIQRPGEPWRDDDNGPMPVGTLVRRKFVRSAPNVARMTRITLRVTGYTEPDADGAVSPTFEPIGPPESHTF